MQDAVISVELVGGSRPLVVKRATDQRGIARLRSEAAILLAARHPGVAAHDGDDAFRCDDRGAELRMRLAGSRTLASVGPLTPAQVASFVASVSATVADLHAVGIVHGRLTPDHVVVAGDGRPVICGFGSARRAVDSTPDASCSPSIDVLALGVLIRDLLSGAPPTTTRSLARRVDSALRRDLQALADQATHATPDRRRSAAHLADALGRLVPGVAPALPDDESDADEATIATDPSTSDAAEVGHSVAPDRRRALVEHLVHLPRRAGIAAGAVAMVVVVAAWGPLTDDAGAPPASTPTIGDSAAVAPALVTTTPAHEDSVDAGPGLDIDLAAGCTADVDGGVTAEGLPCRVEVRVHDSTLVVGDQTFGFDLDAAAVAIGDFRCEGRPIAAVADLSTGGVFVFDAWASTTSSQVSAVQIDLVPGTRQVIAEPTSRGCHRLVVLDEWGLRHLIEPTNAPTSSTLLPQEDTP